MTEDDELFKCGKCQHYKPASEFGKSSTSKSGMQNRCRSCHSQEVREAYARDPALYIERVAARARREPEKIWRNALRQRAKIYGLNPDEVEAAFNAHDGLCDICGNPPNPAHKRNRRLTIDHDHGVVGYFRGFLCHGCNAALGAFEDNPARIFAAIRYLTDGVRLAALLTPDYEYAPRGARGEGRSPNTVLRACARLRGLDPNVIEGQFEDHSGLCDICGEPPTPWRRQRSLRLEIDHDHNQPGVFRGFLCHGCNAGLGGFGDDPAKLAAAIQYLTDSAVKLADAA